MAKNTLPYDLERMQLLSKRIKKQAKVIIDQTTLGYFCALSAIGFVGYQMFSDVNPFFGAALGAIAGYFVGKSVGRNKALVLEASAATLECLLQTERNTNPPIHQNPDKHPIS